ncbi:Subunit of the glycosylphosphatidylinositol transamidase complex-like protein [Coemansia sp. RSA 2706]|nr:Subunit of the glycosylphosphatidylinositol transamidase complex-like protein [Coemansia sp. RSA 2706]KAJ2313677.1 Subunit of the glycosylphosphatidylinositol transamidase complex-like protein [Coemansia sp. RSA 2705]KAJ2318833.1 Subunit of the glycosylphosphatidylinositol transamidase complex-like protein [Coemansia sp. RSA 2704]KAJ2328911.1 Subunit of the glycosylphosphatidylinositol transamidase complex-like protein [Coemansia sp. RSA 2702]KAJ2388915.1 Subunit of the glycosylphosphatidyli
MRVLWPAALAAWGAAVCAETYTEDLLIAPLADGRALLHFDFEMQTDNGSTHSYHVFPRQIGEIAQRYGVEQLQLTFTQGVWREARWGAAPGPHGAGAEVAARLADDSQWAGMANALAGVFCASLNAAGNASAAAPQAMGGVRLAHLAGENVCTENLTPWIKQLPCQAQSGLGALLNPHRLFDMQFLSMGAALDSDGAALRYRQRLSVVVDVGRWSLQALAGRGLPPACPAASRSSIRAVVPPDAQVVPPADTVRGSDDGTTHTYDLLGRGRIDDIEIVLGAGRAGVRAAPAVAAHRFVTGHGGSSGGIESAIENRRDSPVTVTYYDVLPWYLRVYTHTLRIRSTHADGRSEPLVPLRTRIVPAVDRGRSAELELELELPPRSRTLVRYDFDKGFLKYSEHPPDANRGFNVAPAIVVYELAADDRARPLGCKAGEPCAVRVYTEPALASLPTPDFSMPYNVITFTCTILALFFGRIFNLLTRDFAVLTEPAKTDQDGSAK